MKYWITMLTLLISLSASAFEKEDFYNERYCDFLGGTFGQYHPVSETGAMRAFVDCETVTTVWEGEWSHKSYEAVGQVLWYASFTNKIPGIIFYIKKENTEKYIKRAVLTLDSLGIYYRIKIVNLIIPEILDLHIGE